MARTIHPEGDAGAGTYYARDMPTGGHYAQDRRTENVDRLMRGAEPGSGQPATPHGVVRAQDLDTDSVSYLNVSEGPLRAEFEEYMRAVHPETARRIIAGRGSVEVYQDMLYTWAKARAQPIDIDSFQVVALPEYRLGAAQVCVKDAQVVARLHKKSEIVAFATDAPSPRPAAGAR